MIGRNISPLRYPGGKVALFDVLRATIYANKAQGCTYVEPFAGGAGAGVKLLAEGHVDRIIINDRDRAIYCFWKSVLNRTEAFIDRLMTVELTITEWERQREIYRNPGRRSQIDLGFAAFFLNRCNRSGIIVKAGPIGGIEQKGKWKLDARFNREGLAFRVRSIASFEDRVEVLGVDAEELMRQLKRRARNERLFAYADPPYYVKGQALYLNHYQDEDHKRFARLMCRSDRFPWVMTYDDVPRIRELYAGMNLRSFRLRYSAHHDSHEGSELFISPPNVVLPPDIAQGLECRKRNASVVDKMSEDRSASRTPLLADMR